MPTGKIIFTIGTPGEFDDAAIGQFCDIVAKSRSVPSFKLEEGVRSAALIAMAFLDGDVVGTSGLKHPSRVQRKYVSTASGYDLSTERFPYEFGWLASDPTRGRRAVVPLVRDMLERAPTAFFVTMRNNRAWLRRPASQFGVPLGRPYSGVSGQELAVLGKPADGAAPLLTSLAERLTQTNTTSPATARSTMNHGFWRSSL